MAQCTAFLVESDSRFDCERHIGHTNDHQATVREESITWVAKGNRTQLVGLTLDSRSQEVTK